MKSEKVDAPPPTSLLPSANPHNAICSAAQKIGQVACEDDFNFDGREQLGLGACARCMCCVCRLCTTRRKSIFFSHHPLFSPLSRGVEHGSANNVTCGFISEKVIEIPRALGVCRKSRAKWIRSVRIAAYG
jgi:hypothetical protein